MAAETWERYNQDKNIVEDIAEIEIPEEGRYSREFCDLVLAWLYPIDEEDEGEWNEEYFAYHRGEDMILIQPAENHAKTTTQ